MAVIQRLCNHSALLVVGMALGAALVGGWHGATTLPRAHAVATHGSDNFAIATGLVDQQIEALFFLDYLTGDLRAAIVNRRNAQFTGYFQHNVMADFAGISDQPKFLMVTGMAGLVRGAGPSQLGECLIYIAEASSGQVAAYAIPYNSTLQASGAPQRGGFIKVAQGSFRDTFVRDP
jgi:hypothetical protein